MPKILCGGLNAIAKVPEYQEHSCDRLCPVLVDPLLASRGQRNPGDGMVAHLLEAIKQYKGLSG